MSTRGIYVLVGASNQVPKGIRLYQHCDMYPTQALPLIRNAIRKAEKLLVKGRDRFGSGMGYTVTPDMLAGLLIGENTSIHGMGTSIEESRQLVAVTPGEIEGILGNQGDLEWVYVVNTDNQTVNVYGGGYTGEIPAEFLKAGTVEPLTYVENLIEEYQKDEAKAIKSAKRSLARLGWPVNRKFGRRAAIEAEKAKAA